MQWFLNYNGGLVVWFDWVVFGVVYFKLGKICGCLIEGERDLVLEYEIGYF